MAVATRQNVSLVEPWSRFDWAGYDTYQAFTNSTGLGRLPSLGYPISLSTQRHINVRTFTEPEGWTNNPVGSTFVPGYQAAFNSWPGATLNLITGSSTFTSNRTIPLDLSKLGPSALLTMALPNFPAANINLNGTYLDLTSDGFSATLCALPWSTATPTPSSGNTSLTWPLSALTGVDLTKVNGVRLRITATGNASVVVMALRLIDPAWVRPSVDFDNLNGRLRSSPPRNGDPANVVPANAVMPILWRAAPVTGADDPRPINTKMGYVFNTGSQSQANSFTLYMREGAAAPTQLDLQSTSQATLQNHPQPNAALALYAPRTQGDLDQMTQAQLDTMTMTSLERINAPTTSSWISFNVTWGPTPQVQVTNSSNQNDGYIYSGAQAPSLANNTSYFTLCSLTDVGAQLTIYAINQTTQALGDPVFDTTLMADGYLFKRRPGRIGFQAILQNGDTYVQALRPQSVMFAEYRSAPLNSITPVVGARLYAKSSPNLEYWSGWVATTADGNGNSPTMSMDKERTVTHALANPDVDHGTIVPSSTKVTVVTPDTSVRTPAQGLLSNVLTQNAADGITDFNHMQISFDLWFPAAAALAGSNIQAQLINSNGGVIQLNVPRIIPDQWQHVVMVPNASVNLLAGLYTLKVYYQGTVAATWWIDNVSVFERTMRWSARAVADDPWHSNTTPWTDFHELLNSDTDGVRFYQRGTQLQLRAHALRQNAVVVGAPQLVPKYAELGRLVWPEDTIPDTNPVASFSVAPVAHGVPATFNAGASTSANSIIGYRWNFGDGGQANGVTPTHTFAKAGSYTATLMVIDQYGMTGIRSSVIGVS